MMRYVVAALLASAFHSALGQNDYPTKSVRLIVPFAPGGGTDIVALRKLMELGSIGCSKVARLSHWGSKFQIRITRNEASGLHAFLRSVVNLKSRSEN